MTPTDSPYATDFINMGLLEWKHNILNQMNRRYTTHIWHDTDRDGYGSKYAAWKWANVYDVPDVVYVPIKYRNRPTDEMMESLSEGDKVYILDYSFPVDVLFEIRERLGRQGFLYVIDHHASFERDIWEFIGDDPIHHHTIRKNEDAGSVLAGSTNFTLVEDAYPYKNIQVLMDTSHSAAVLTWNVFMGSKGYAVPKILEYVEDYDIWKWELDNTDEILLAFDAHDFTIMENFDTAGVRMNTLYTEGCAIKRYQDQIIDSICSRAKVGPFAGLFELPCAHVSCPPEFSSKVGNRLLELHPEALFAAVYSIYDNGSVAVGLRGNDRVDCSRIAKVFGGGGHPNASGFKTTFGADVTNEQIEQLLTEASYG